MEVGGDGGGLPEGRSGELDSLLEAAKSSEKSEGVVLRNSKYRQKTRIFRIKSKDGYDASVYQYWHCCRIHPCHRCGRPKEEADVHCTLSGGLAKQASDSELANMVRSLVGSMLKLVA